MYHLSRTTFNSVMNLHVELTDYKQKKKHLYKPSTVLLIDEYNSVSIIQLDKVLVFPSCPYTKAASYMNDENFIGSDVGSATAVSASILIQFNQPISVRLLNKCTNKLTVGSSRSLKIVPQ
ncbi:unnamed protein product [Rotaria magnacalcarata]|uniref:Uncharacterized protein n=1 Tax=Rotaria magnacalcarata TaxID=392030 RepID=A0A816T306_9BILA|nr:unnamed protein product [Rotaria magnacalcarata]